MPARLYLAFNEWINEANAPKWTPPPVTKWPVHFLCFSILNFCPSLFQIGAFIGENTSGHTCLLLDKATLKDTTRNLWLPCKHLKSQKPDGACLCLLLPVPFFKKIKKTERKKWKRSKHSNVASVVFCSYIKMCSAVIIVQKMSL